MIRPRSDELVRLVLFGKVTLDDLADLVRDHLVPTPVSLCAVRSNVKLI